jgi:hypothetical protein
MTVPIASISMMVAEPSHGDGNCFASRVDCVPSSKNCMKNGTRFHLDKSREKAPAARRRGF